MLTNVHQIAKYFITILNYNSLSSISFRSTIRSIVQYVCNIESLRVHN